MHIWIIILFATAGVVFGLDYLFRRKKWKDNSKAEKISLLVNMFSVAPYIYLSALGMLWGIVTYAPETSLGEIIYEVTLRMASIYFIIAVIAVILSFVLRIKDKNKASVGTNIIALLYIVVILALNLFAGKLL
jgi:hypothetical protein